VNLVNAFTSSEWKPAADVARPWVKFRNDESSSGAIWHVPAPNDPPRLSLIIPTADADRGGYFASLLEQIEAQDFHDFEMIAVKGDLRQGRAINVGAALAQGKYLMTLDDDSSLPDSHTFSRMVAAMEAHPDIGMAGGNNTVPEWATPFVKRVMCQVPRRSWEPVDEITDSDLAEHPCLIIRADVFREVGGENELLPRGLDPYLRQEFRKTGYRVCLVPGVIYHHLPPDTWAKLIRQFYRNGCQAAYVNKYYPQWVIETPSNHGSFTQRVPLWKRIFRYPLKMLASLLRGHVLWFACQCSYACGFIVVCLKNLGRRQ